MVKRDHELVPVHRIMSASEIKKLLEEMDLKAYNLPKIRESDPQAKKIGAKPGDVLEIDREDMGKSYKQYRQVIEG